MAIEQSALPGIGEIEAWQIPADQNTVLRFIGGIWHFARRKPLGFFCGLTVIVFAIFGDLVPVTADMTYGLAKEALHPFGINLSAKMVIDGAACSPVPCLATSVAKYSFDQNHLRDRLQGHSSKYILGTDNLGRDIFSRLMYGARVSVVVPFGAVMISETIGATIGITSGYYGGWYDKVMQQVVNIFQSLPALVVFITVFGILKSGLWQMILVIGLFQGPIASRVIRGQVFSIMSSPFIESARVIGANDRRIMVRYVLPNVFALIILGSTIRLGGVVLLEATLSFLGFGLPPPFPSWGQMLSIQGREYMRTAPGLAIYPGIAIAIIVFSYNLFGDALRDVLDPRLRGSR